MIARGQGVPRCPGDTQSEEDAGCASDEPLAVLWDRLGGYRKKHLEYRFDDLPERCRKCKDGITGSTISTLSVAPVQSVSVRRRRRDMRVSYRRWRPGNYGNRCHSRDCCDTITTVSLTLGWYRNLDENEAGRVNPYIPGQASGGIRGSTPRSVVASHQFESKAQRNSGTTSRTSWNE